MSGVVQRSVNSTDPLKREVQWPLIKCGCADVWICRFWNWFGWSEKLQTTADHCRPPQTTPQTTADHHRPHCVRWGLSV